jgi:hypothetical protein
MNYQLQIQQVRLRAMEANLRGKIEIATLKCGTYPKRKNTAECRILWDEIRQLTGEICEVRRATNIDK